MDKCLVIHYGQNNKDFSLTSLVKSDRYSDSLEISKNSYQIVSNCNKNWLFQTNTTKYDFLFLFSNKVSSYSTKFSIVIKHSPVFMFHILIMLSAEKLHIFSFEILARRITPPKLPTNVFKHSPDSISHNLIVFKFEV